MIRIRHEKGNKCIEVSFGNIWKYQPKVVLHSDIQITRHKIKEWYFGFALNKYIKKLNRIAETRYTSVRNSI